MVTVGMYYDVIPGKAAAVPSPSSRQSSPLLETMPGHSESFLYQRVDDPDSYAILSEWDDRQAFLDFIRSDAFRQVTTWGREQVLRGAPRGTRSTLGAKTSDGTVDRAGRRGRILTDRSVMPARGAVPSLSSLPITRALGVESDGESGNRFEETRPQRPSLYCDAGGRARGIGGAHRVAD